MSDKHFSIKEIREFIKEDTLEFPFTLKLKKPFQYTESERVETIKFCREPEAGDLDDMPVQEMKFGDFYIPLAKITKKPLPYVRKIKMSDMKGCMEILNHFLVDSEEDGKDN